MTLGSRDSGVRIWVTGPPGAGKSTLASAINDSIGIPHVELDELYWLPLWRPRTLEAFRSLVRLETRGDNWIIDGHYSQVIDVIVARMTAFVWVDAGLPRSFWQVMRRSVRRVRQGERVCGQNTETLGQLFGRNSMAVWAVASRRGVRSETLRVWNRCGLTGVPRVRLPAPVSAEELLLALRESWSSTESGREVRRC